jgi:GxxExxY protein
MSHAAANEMITEQDPLTRGIIGAAIEVHKHLGPGLLESAYEACMAIELGLRSFAFTRQVEVPIRYKSASVPGAYRIDFLVEDAVVVELKAIEKFAPIHEAQLLTYLRLTGKRTGLLINFNAPYLRDGIMRRVL